jgi:hypothetical protein
LPSWEKAKDCAYIVLIAYFGGKVIDLFIYDLSLRQCGGIALMVFAAVLVILKRSTEQADQVQEVLEAKRIEVANIERVK